MAISEYTAEVEISAKKAASLVGSAANKILIRGVSAMVLLPLLKYALNVLAGKTGRQMFRKRDGMYHGQQTLKQLNQQGRELTHINVDNMPEFRYIRKEFQKYGVDFAMLHADDGSIHIHFKAQDADRAELAINRAKDNFEKFTTMNEVRSKAEKSAFERECAKYCHMSVEEFRSLKTGDKTALEDKFRNREPIQKPPKTKEATL